MSAEMPPATESLIGLPAEFASRYGVPVIGHVDPAIFRRTYFTHCLACGYCHDACCQYGVDVDLWHHERIMEHADAVEAFTGITRDRWFTGTFERDADLPGGGAMRTAVEDGSCVFLNRAGRGCLLHAYCVDAAVDHRELKSIVDCLFPASFYDDTLSVADEVDENELICLDTGPTVYRGARDNLAYYFGEAFVTALDRIEREVVG